MAQTINRKRAVIAGAAALLIAGVSVGGALVTTNSTIFDNVFETEAVPANPGELLVDGPALSHSYTGAVDGELASEYYTLTNTSATQDLKFNLNTRVQPGGSMADELASELSTRIGVAGVTTATGTLKDMNIAGGDQITVPAGSSIVLRLDVFVEDKDAFIAAGLGDDSQVTVDFLFDSIFLP
ncbi:hypothetical protein JOF42_000400 [Microbacterium phyllosphaerae]|uniref:Uncharacterized protein n=1 Tax=Microbacterium phyllosphaerae TaxID=124798 RepID=A0ABS4WL26_9MICO|nr:hypothetical protein [Microbacterium phyllosphaerae]MBP2376905.1 hypothetical protein [Microbacterium phyllosphaerae]